MTIQKDKKCKHWFRELMRNDNKKWFFYCQKCLKIVLEEFPQDVNRDTKY